MIKNATVAVIISIVLCLISVGIVSAKSGDTKKAEQTIQMCRIIRPQEQTEAKKITQIKKPLKIEKTDCEEYRSEIEKYDWPVETAMWVCYEESNGYPNAVGDTTTKYVSVGLFQIRTLDGRPSEVELKDVKTNIEWAYKIWKEGGWQPWSVCHGGKCN
jgi:hypothetical protein